MKTAGLFASFLLLSVGAVGGELETAKWQAEIDRVSAAGGGEVVVPAGVHTVGTLFLKNGVTLRLAKDCVLDGSTDINNYPDIPLQYAEYPEPWQALVAAVGQRDVAVVGEGVISGNGPKFPLGTRLGRPRGMLLYRCRNVKLEDFKLFDLPCWSCYIKECDDVTVRRVKIDAHGNDNNDGFDIDSRNVLIEDCDIDSDDDAIVLKSDNPDFFCENVVVRNCRARSDCNVIKFGTASHGGFRNVLIEGIRAGASRRHTVKPRKPGQKSWREETWPGSPARPVPLGGIAIECVDGGLTENITIRDVELEECSVPIFIRGGQRKLRTYGKELELHIPFGRHSVLRNVTIENVRAKSVCWTASSITGVPGLRLQNIVLRNLDIEVPGAGEAGRVEIGVPVPEKANDHPESNMFDARMLPAYGFYIRHADGVTLDNVNVRVAGSEVRPELVTEDVTDFVSRPALALFEPPFAFKSRLSTVHRTDRRDVSAVADQDEYVLPHGVQIVYAPDAPELVKRAAADFCDYLIVSMRVNASVKTAGTESKPGLMPSVSVKVRPDAPRGYAIDTTSEGVKIVASEAKMAAQAFYHLEDRMNNRRGPFLKFGAERRNPIFNHRITFGGFGNDIFPDAHLNQLAHHGFTDIEVWLDDYDVISQGPRQDVNDLIDRAAKFGLGVFFEPRNRAYVHPDDPRAEAMYEAAYGRLTQYYPKVMAATFCGEVCEFPSKDPRCNGGDHKHQKPEDFAKGLPYPGWFPCSDWADWVKKVKPIFNRYSPEAKFVFMTYNWGSKDEQARADLIAALPKDIVLIPTFESNELHAKRNGLISPVADYSIAFPGPGKYFRTEAAQAKAAGIELWSNCNSAGLTWDFGNIPYQPVPWQWKKRWDALKSAHEQYNLTGLRESHEYGWTPSFISELEKEYLTEGGDDFETCLRKLATRDFGAENVEKALAAWKLWSRAAEDYVPSDDNQYGPCRIGPAYPFNFFGPDLQERWAPPKDFPLEANAKFTICHFDYAKPIAGLGCAALGLDESFEQKEIELFQSQVADYRAGALLFEEIAATLPVGRRDEALRQAALGRYLMHTCQTAVNVKLGRRAFLKNDRAEVERLARLEYANAEAALKVVDMDSRLGWLVSSGYTGGRAQIEWKLRKMRELYGCR